MNRDGFVQYTSHQHEVPKLCLSGIENFIGNTGVH